MQPQTLVPPGRLGALLIKQRNELGCTVADLAARSDRFRTLDLDRLERGAADLDEYDIGAVMDLYGLDLSSGSYARSELVVDLGTGQIGTRETSLAFEGRAADVVLERYVSLLYLLRDVPVGADLALRANDVDTLTAALERSSDQLLADVEAIINDQRTVDRTRHLSRRRRVLQAGLLVGASLVGSLVIVGDFVPTASASIAETPAQRGAAAFATLDFDFEQVLPGWTVRWGSDHPIYGGMTQAPERRITIHVDPQWNEQRLADILMHEIGHAIDLEYLGDEARREWMSMRNIENGWWTGNGLRDFDVGAGDFAEAVASTWLGSESDSHHGDFTDHQLDFVRDLLADLLPTPRTTST